VSGQRATPIPCHATLDLNNNVDFLFGKANDGGRGNDILASLINDDAHNCDGDDACCIWLLPTNSLKLQAMRRIIKAPVKTQWQIGCCVSIESFKTTGVTSDIC